CAPCGCAMTPSCSTKGGRVRYRYYVCTGAQKRGFATCPSKSIPAAQVEGFVVDRLKAAGLDPALVAEVLAQARRQADDRLAELDAERRGMERDLAAAIGDTRRLASRLGRDNDHGVAVARLVDLQERTAGLEARLENVREEAETVRRERV